MINVYLNSFNTRYFVGILKEQNKKIYFEYDKDFLKTNIQISPFYLPLEEGIFTEPKMVNDGLHGVFNDSLPDGWGRLLLDRYLNKQGLSYNTISPLMRLSLTGKNGMGALEYEPSQEYREHYEHIDLDELSCHSTMIFNEQETKDLQKLIQLNGSSAGARPKIICYLSKDKTKISGEYKEGYEAWLIKFPSSADSKNIGLEEYVYSLLAKDAGLDFPDTHLFESNICPGFYGVKRFDRTDNNEKIHIHTAAGLLNLNFREPSLDYSELLKLTSILTQDNNEVKKMLRLMVFNVKAGNKDDHAKNFSFMLNKENQWQLTPAYDLTQSSGINGEHTTSILGKGKNISNEDIHKLASQFDISKQDTNAVIEQVEDAMSNYQRYFNEYSDNSPRI